MMTGKKHIAQYRIPVDAGCNRSDNFVLYKTGII